MIHKKLICDSSDFFKKAFTGNFQEGQKGIMEMPDDSPGSMPLFIDWLYRGVVPVGDTEAHLYNLYDLYFMADKLCLVVLKDKTMDTINFSVVKNNMLEIVASFSLLSKVIRNLVGREEPGEDTGLRDFSMCCLCVSLNKKALIAFKNEPRSADPGHERLRIFKRT